MAGLIEASLNLTSSPRPKRWYRPWSWFRRNGDLSIEPEHLSEEERAAARALEAALDITPSQDSSPEMDGRTASPLPADPGGQRRGWSEDAPLEAKRAPFSKARPPVTPRTKQTAGVVATPLPRDGARRTRLPVVAPRARLHVEDRPTGEAQDTWGLAKLSDTVTAASSRDDLAGEIVEYVAQHFKRAAVFAVRQQRATGWMGKGPGFFPERIGQTVIRLDTPSLFTDVDAPYIGPVPEIVENRELYAFLGGTVPPAVLIVPVMIRDRLVSVIYADNDAEPLVWIDLAVWKRVAEMMAIALEIIILKNRARTL